MSKRLLALAFVVGALAVLAFPSFAGGLHVEHVRWITSAAATAYNGGASDSAFFSETGAANATRDTSTNIDISGIFPGGSITPAADSSLFIRFTLKPLAGTTLGTGADSLYSYIETVHGDGAMSGVLTNLTEVLSLELGTSNVFTWKITKARAALLYGASNIRWIVRGDLNGQWEGEVAFYSDDTKYGH